MATKEKLLWLIPMAALGIALFEMPYSYYSLLRLLVCGVCLFLVTREVQADRTEWAWVLGGCAVLYNPIFRVHLDREIWSFVNAATIGLLAVHLWSSGRYSRTES